MTHSISEPLFEAWLDRYGAAWEACDADAFVALFDATDLRYYWSPFTPPKKNHAELRAAFEAATASQRRVHFGYQIVAIHHELGIAHWRCRFVRADSDQTVTIDGILSAEFSDGSCRIFREWWHSDEHEKPED